MSPPRSSADLPSAPNDSGAPVVLGLGNRAGGDDSVGLRIVEKLASHGVGAIAVTSGAALIDALMTVRKAIIADAVIGPFPVGTVVYFDGPELFAHVGRMSASSHSIPVGQAVKIAHVLGGAQDVQFVGVAIGNELAKMTSSSELSGPVELAVHEAALRIAALVKRAANPLGADATGTLPSGSG
ncbi:MAG: hydrogenase maturation protease [Polyangiaceae bacterium]|nr:hydrogenase maturation protease [Polyangiaceae bacterium]